MREMRGEVGKKTLKKEMDNPTFYDVTGFFELLSSRTNKGTISQKINL